MTMKNNSRRWIVMSTCVLTILILCYSNYFVSEKVLTHLMNLHVGKYFGLALYETKTYDFHIIVMVYNRAASLKRILHSLNEAEYDGDSVVLNVWIDRHTNGKYDNNTASVAREFQFKHGDYVVNIHKKHAGIYGQWLNTYTPDPNNGSEIVLFLEDDITVSPYYYKYLKLVHAKYDKIPDVNGYSLNGAEMKMDPRSQGYISGPPDEPVLKYPVLGSWGFSPNIPHWKRFLQWYDTVHRDKSFHPYVPNCKATEWYKAHEKQKKSKNMWTMWHIYYAWSNKEYTIFCNFPDHQGLTTNWAEKGLHYAGNKGGVQSNPLLQYWNLTYSMLPDEPVELDTAGNVVDNRLYSDKL